MLQAKANVKWMGARLQGRLRQAAIIAVQRLAQETLQEQKRLLNKSGHGRYYPSRTGKGIHRASAAGEPPAPDTRKLINSVRITKGTSPLNLRVGSPLKYALYLEFGTKRMAPRPWIRPSINKIGKRAPKVFREEFSKVLRKR